MNKQLLSVLSLSLLVSLAPSCKKENGKKKKMAKKVDVLNSKVLAASYDDELEDIDRTLADADIEQEEDEVVTQF